MYFWGLTIDTVTSVMLILAIGLCIDYAAHIGHSFMTSKASTRNGTYIICKYFMFMSELACVRAHASRAEGLRFDSDSMP